MRIANKTAKAIAKGLGVDSRLIATKTENLLSGLARGEKKKAGKVLLRIAKRGEATPSETEQLTRLVGRTRPKTAGTEVEGMLTRIETSRTIGQALNPKNITGEISQVISEDINRMFTVHLTPESIDNIVKEATKATYRDIPAQIGRTAFEPIAFVMRQFGVKKGAEWTTYKAWNITAGKTIREKGKKVLLSPVSYIASRFIPKAERTALRQLVKLPKEKFGQAYYQFLLESKGLKGRAPLGYTVTDKGAPLFTECYGLTNRMTNTMTFTRELPQLTLYKQANLIRHEMTHYQQIEAQIQAFGIDGYIQTLKTNELNILTAENPNKTRKELAEIIEKEWKADNIEEIIKKAFAGASELPRIPKGTKQYAMALKYREATESYIPPQTKPGLFFTTVKFGKGYTESGLEKEAYKKGFWAGMRTKIMELLHI